uniref:Uncharacterized protein n=1 Tax=Arion vulgaris TaxID=1028688 RepID=A0A0B7BH97_9EUPU
MLRMLLPLWITLGSQRQLISLFAFLSMEHHHRDGEDAKTLPLQYRLQYRQIHVI